MNCALGEEIQVVLPLRWVVRITIDVPDVRDVLFLQVRVHGLTDADEAIFLAAAEPE